MRTVERSIDIRKSARTLQIASMFDLPPAERSTVSWNVDLPLDAQPWNVGLIVGPSGCGKSVIAEELFGEKIISGYEWDPALSVVDGFPYEMSVSDVSAIIGSVGFNSPPSWLKPFHVLSNGEKFRVTMARALAESAGLVVIDEFTSVIDRQVAQIARDFKGEALREPVRDRAWKLANLWHDGTGRILI